VIRLTRAGSLVAAGALVALVAGRLLGLDEITVLGAAALLTVLVAVTWLPLPALQATLTVEPARVPVGAPSAAHLVVANLGRRTRRATEARVRAGDGTEYEAALDRIAPGATMHLEVPLPTDHRGIHSVGPVSIMRTDPFGLARRVRQLPVTPARYVVLPRVTRIAPVLGGKGDDPLASGSRAHARAEVGEEFATLRPYATGDDLRRVHWPSSARQGDLVVRREERPLQRRCTVVVDTRAEVHRGESLEPLVRAAASVLAASARRGDAIRLRTTTGFDAGLGSGRHHLAALFDDLAALTAEHPGTAATTSHRRAGDGDGAVVLLTTPWAQPARPRRRGGAAVLELAITDDDAFHESWRRLMGVPDGRARRRPAHLARGWGRSSARA
jgi:uncharacterized protein (DUF58 family)